jgi:hypothetical protein
MYMCNMYIMMYTIDLPGHGGTDHASDNVYGTA